MDYTLETAKKKLSAVSKTTTSKYKTKDVESSSGLYSLAVQKGLKVDADRVLEKYQGEKTKEIYSGGIISDTFDTLNALQYGVTGTIQGIGFQEGVKTRASFSDKGDDKNFTLGDNGIPGMIAGTLLDIAFDPLTYIPPTAIAKRIPGAVKGAEIAKKAIFGKDVIKTVDAYAETGKLLSKTFTEKEGGTKIGRYLADKFVWMNGADPVYKKAFERMTTNIGVSQGKITEISRNLAKLTDSTASKILKLDETGRVVRVPLQDLQKLLSPEEFGTVERAWTQLEKLGQDAVNVGLLSKEKYEENIGEYLKNAYTEFELDSQKTGLFGKKSLGVSKQQTRIKGLTAEKMQELGQIKNPAYLFYKSSFNLTKDIENAKFFNFINDNFASTSKFDGSMQLAKSGRYMTTQGIQAGFKKEVGDINTQLKPLFKELKFTFKADRKFMSEVKGLEKQIDDLNKLSAEELTKFFSGTTSELATSATKVIKQGVEMLPENLQTLGSSISKFNSLEEVMKSDVGIQLEKAFIDGDLEKAGFTKTKETTALKQFFDYIKTPSKLKEGKDFIKPVTDETTIKNVVDLQKQIQKLTNKSNKLKEIDKTSINNSLIHLEKQLSDLSFAKENIVEEIKDLKLGELSGKFVPENVFTQLEAMSEPWADNFGTKLVAAFKYNKVILNPAAMVRNGVSNTVLNWWKLGIGPWRLDLYTEAIKEVNSKGQGKWIKELVDNKVGYGIDSMASQELRGLLDGPEFTKFGTGIGKKFSKLKNAISNIYEGEENIAKVAAYIAQRKKGFGVEESWKAAVSATFNYAQVTPFVRKLRSSIWGVPFATFTIKATPLVLETVAKHPGRISVFGKIKNAIEQQSDTKETDREKSSAPAWIRDGFYVKLPMKDKEGRSAYFDLTYIIPFGDLVSGNFLNRGTMKDTGTSESIPSALFGKAPVLNTIKELSRNQNFYGRSIWRDSDTTEKQLQDISKYLSKAILPPAVADQIPSGYDSKGNSVTVGVNKALTETQKDNQQRTITEELLRNVGIKIQPVDVDIQETMNEWNKKKALGTLLRERGILNTGYYNYVPKKP